MTNKEAAIKIIKQLRSNGFEALLAGGCVRDMLLKRGAKDYDVATNAFPDEIVRLFKRTLKVGVKFGVVIVLLDGIQIEVATFRKEAGYADGRHPESIHFTTAAGDASRRDFTINGMFYDPLEKKVIDFVGGQADLKKKILRTIGDPYERLREDFLRMLRAIRFSTQLGFRIEPQTFDAIRANTHNITKISGERICTELEGILTNPHRSAGLDMLERTSLIEQIFPGLLPEQINFAKKVLDKLPSKTDFALPLAAVFSGCSTDFAIRKIAVLKTSRELRRQFTFLLNNRDKLLAADMSLSQLKMMLAQTYFWNLYEFQKALQKAEDKSISSLAALRRRIEKLGPIELKPKPLLNGHELMKLGAKAGPTLGRLAQEMYIAQLETHITTKQQAKKWVKNWLKKHLKIKP